MKGEPDVQNHAESQDADKFGGEDADVRKVMPPDEPSEALESVLEGGTSDNLTNTEGGSGDDDSAKR